MTKPIVIQQQPADLHAARETLRRIAADMDSIELTFDCGTHAVIAEHASKQIADVLARHTAAISALTAILWNWLPTQPPANAAVRCPLCRQMVTPEPDGTLPAHELQPGPKRSPICRFRGAVKDGAQWTHC